MNQVTLALGFGIVTSAILALGAVGFTLQFGVSNIFNLAYGNVMTVATFVAYLVNVRAGQSIWLAVAAVDFPRYADAYLAGRLPDILHRRHPF